MTLIEAMLAIAVLAIGFAGVVTLLGSVSAAGRKSAFHNIALDVFTAFSAQVQNANCDFTPDLPQVDPAFAQTTWYDGTPATGSSITLIGQVAAAMSGAMGTTAPVTLAYKAIQTTGDCPGNCTNPDSYLVQVQICDMSDLNNQPCPTPVNGTTGYGSGYWIRTFELTKTCSIRLDNLGRGEFY